MNIFKRKQGSKRSLEKTGIDTAPTSDFWYSVLGAGRSIAGQTVTAETASRVASVYACKVAITESIAMLPAVVKEQVDERTTATRSDHELYKLLHDSPNDFQDSFEFFEVMQTSAFDHGDGFAFIDRTKTGRIKSLIPLQTQKMTVLVLPGNRLGYRYRNGGEPIDYTDREIFHFKPFSKDGIRGRTPINVAADSIGFALGLQAHGNKTFENGAFLSGFLKAPFAFKTDEQRTGFMNSFKSIFGSNNSGKMGLLENGVEFVPYSMNNQEAQFLESKKFSVVEIARIFRMPPHMIQDLSQGASYSSIEQQSINFVVYTVQPWLTRWERAINRQLLHPENDKLFAKFNERALLRGDLKSRTEALVLQLNNGLKTINEARNLEDENPIDDEIGDKIFISHNSIPADQVGKVTSGGTVKKEKDPEVKSSKREKILPLVEDFLLSAQKRENSEIQKQKSKPEFFSKMESFFPEHKKRLKEKLSLAANLVKEDFHDDLEEFFRTYFEDFSEDLLKNLNTPGEMIRSQNIKEQSQKFLEILEG